MRAPHWIFVEQRARRGPENTPIALIPKAPTVPRVFRPTVPAVRKGGALEPLRLQGSALVEAILRDKDEIAIAVHAVGSAERCLSIAARYLGCRSALLRHADPKRGADLVVATRGAAEELLMIRARPDQRLLTDSRHAVVAHASIGGARLATIEIAEPHDDRPFNGEDIVALTNLGALYASVIRGRGVLTDAAEVARYALSSSAKV